MTRSWAVSSGNGVITVFTWEPQTMDAKNSITVVTPVNIRMMETSAWTDLFTRTVHRAPV